MSISRVLAMLLILISSSAVLAADAYTIDLAHSAAMFRVKRMGVVYVYGRFNDFSGSLTFDEANPSSSSIEIEVKTESVDSNSQGRDRHLRSPDFLNATQFPVMTYKSTAVKKTGENTYEVIGDLSLHGVTKSITAKVEKVGSGKDERRGRTLVGFETQFMFKRSEFDMNFMVGPLGDEVYVTLAIHGVGQ